MRIFPLATMNNRLVLLSLAAAIAASGQTQLDLRTQSRNVDFSSSPSTKPARTGVTLPGTCTVGEVFFKSDAIPGQNLHVCSSTNTWTTVIGTPGTGGAATSTSQLYDFQVVRINGTVLQVGVNCTTQTPCGVRYGNRAFSVQSGANFTLSGTGTGTLRLYLTPNGELAGATDGNLSVTCAGGACQVHPGVAAYPADAIPIAQWTANTGVWDENGGLDARGFLSNKQVAAGTGLIASDLLGVTTLSVDTTALGFRVAPPATATSTCTAGSWAANTSFHYVCIATNTWRRVALSAW